jgi:hypothetical protein
MKPGLTRQTTAHREQIKILIPLSKWAELYVGILSLSSLNGPLRPTDAAIPTSDLYHIRFRPQARNPSFLSPGLP